MRHFILLVALLVTTFGNSYAQTQSQNDDSEAVNSAADIMLTNPLDNQQNMVDRTVVFEGSAAWDSATTQTLTRIEETDGIARLVLNDQRARSFPRRGSWVSPEIKGEFSFTEVLPSWNVDTPENTGAAFEIRVRDAESGEWSPYLYIGQWGRSPHFPARRLTYENGKVHMDILKLSKAADAVQMKVNLFSYDIGEWKEPSVRLLTVVYSTRVDDDAERARLTKKLPIDGQWARSLPVPFHPQGFNPDSIRGSTCSPTSTKMVMEYRGVNNGLTETALGIWDQEYGIFGNWGRAVSYAGHNGLRSHLTRVRTYEDVKAYIAAGQPLIASIKFKDGEFPSNVNKSSGGHLIVVRGMTPEGDIIVNDPASIERGNAIVYKADELANAWFRKGGVAYVIGPPINGSDAH